MKLPSLITLLPAVLLAAPLAAGAVDPPVSGSEEAAAMPASIEDLRPAQGAADPGAAGGASAQVTWAGQPGVHGADRSREPLKGYVDRPSLAAAIVHAGSGTHPGFSHPKFHGGAVRVAGLHIIDLDKGMPHKAKFPDGPGARLASFSDGALSGPPRGDGSSRSPGKGKRHGHLAGAAGHGGGGPVAAPGGSTAPLGVCE